MSGTKSLSANEVTAGESCFTGRWPPFDHSKTKPQNTQTIQQRLSTSRAKWCRSCCCCGLRDKAGILTLATRARRAWFSRLPVQSKWQPTVTTSFYYIQSMYFIVTGLKVHSTNGKGLVQGHNNNNNNLCFWISQSNRGGSFLNDITMVF